MSRPLEGLLAVSIEQAVAAPMCTLRLADAGARVIKIEREEGETARHYDKAVFGVSAYFAWLNRGKESCVLDLKSADDLALAHRMIAKADVFVQNFAPGAMQRLGLGAHDLVSLNPRLIAVDIVGYGQDTDYRNMRAYDMLVQAESGLCAVTGTPETPSKVGVSVSDIATGMNAQAMVLEALIARSMSGKGRVIEVAMFDSIADWMSVPMLHLKYGGRTTERHGLSHASIYPYAPFTCKDGDVVISIQNPKEWQRFCAGMLGDVTVASDMRFHDNPSRLTNRSALDQVILAVFGKMTCAEVIAKLEENDIAWAKCSTVDDALKHPALRNFPVALDDSTLIDLPLPAGREKFIPGPVPGLGEHTQKIRQEFA